MLIDEADTFAANSDDLRCIVNSGHTRSAAYVVRTVGEDFTPRKFSTWSAMAIAAIGKLPATIEDRSILINLSRRRLEEKIERLRPDRIEDLQQMASRAARWAADHMIELASSDPKIPDALHDRAADNWRPLLAIADAAGGDWSVRARRAALELSNDTSDQESIGALLLSDIRAMFAAKDVDRISGDELTAHLLSLDDRPWSEFKKGRPLTKATLARHLGRYKILSGTIRLPDGRTLRGYYLSSFTDAFARYLSLHAATPPQLNDDWRCDALQSVTLKTDVTVSKSQKPNNRGGCDGVTVRGCEKCAHCGGPETQADPLLEVAIDGDPRLLHRRCMDAYAASDIPPFLRRAQAVRPWTEDEVVAYENRWPIGTRQRVWLDVLLYTGLRRGDAVRLGRQHHRDGIAMIKTEKTGTAVALPILPVLAKTLAAGPCGDLTFIAGASGRPFTKESFGNEFREACRTAGVAGSAHGVRKIAATRAANAGATVAQLEAIFGWQGGAMASLYTRAAGSTAACAGRHAHAREQSSNFYRRT
jgi:integrase